MEHEVEIEIRKKIDEIVKRIDRNNEFIRTCQQENQIERFVLAALRSGLEADHD